MYSNSQNSDITVDELITMFSKLSETDKQVVREFIYLINFSSENEQLPDPSASKN